VDARSVPAAPSALPPRPIPTDCAAGWITWFAWVSLLAGVANVTAVMIQGLAILNNPSYVPERWHITLIIFAMLIVEGLMTMYAFWLIPWIELLAGILHVVLFIIFVVVLVALAPRHTADFVFFDQQTSSGWSNSFISWNIGLLTPTWGFVGEWVDMGGQLPPPSGALLTRLHQDSTGSCT